MKTIVQLDKEDIIKTIANAFDVDKKSVLLEITETWDDYGPGEHRVQTIMASVTLKGETP
jgi:hypothetical protein